MTHERRPQTVRVPTMALMAILAVGVAASLFARAGTPRPAISGRCTIVVEPSTATKAIQVYEFDGKRLHLVAKGTSSCDLTSIGGGKRAMSWDTDVTLPVFAQP